MKTCIIGLILPFLGLGLLSCDEEPRRTQVWGKFSCTQCTSTFEPQGTLAKKGGDFYGWCTRTEDGLNFAVGQKNPQDPDFSGEFFYEVRGIQGPPTEGVFVEGSTSYKSDPSLKTTFSSMQLLNTNHWIFTSADIPDPDQCYIQLFAEPTEGELTPTQYGAEPFELFVLLDCRSIAVESPQGATLTATSIQVFFDECD